MVADSNMSLQITGNGDVLEPHDGIIGEFVIASKASKDWFNEHGVVKRRPSAHLCTNAYCAASFSQPRPGRLGDVEC